MQSALLTSSRFGKFYPKSEQNHKKLELKSSGPLQKIQFTVTGDKIYLLDTTGNLICLTLDDSSISTFGTVKSQHFQIDSYNSFSVYAVSKQSQLWHVSFQSKKKDKIVNLSMGRVLSFQKNPFTNLLLIVELQLVMIISPSSNNYKITSIKSTNGQVFTCGKFLNQNRFLILAIKTNQLRLVQVLGLKTIETITLPFDIKGLKLQTTSDGSAIAVFGESNMLVIVNVNPNGKLRFKICELPVKSVLELKFTYENDIIFLGNNRIIYGIDAQKKGKIVQIFNYSDKIGFSSFDISLNSKKLALISGSSVHILTYPSGIHKIIEQSKGSILQFTYQGGQSTLKVDRQIEYDDEQLDSSTQNLQKHSNYIGDLPKFDQKSVEPELELPQQINTLKIPHSQKIRVHKIFNFLYEIDHLRRLAHLHKKQTIQLIAKYLTISPNPTKVLLGVYHLLSTYEKAIEDESMQRYALILAPRVFERVQKVDGQFKHYLTKQLLSTFQDYLSQSKQSQIIKILLKNSQRQWFVPIFLVCLLMQLRNHSQSWPHPHIQQLQLDQVLKETQNLLQNPRHAYIFAKQPIKRTQDDEQNLQSLLRKQNELKKELEQVRRQYN